MRKYLFLLALTTIILTSCSLDDGEQPPQTVFLPIESVEVPEQFIHGETHEIFVTYNRPTPCHVFNNIFFDTDGQERTVAIINSVYNGPDCTPDPVETTVSFDFTVFSQETYIFKFYQGVDETGSDSYHIVEVPVVVD